jgi:hypothetical protein
MGSMKNVLTTKLHVEKRLRIDLACIRQGLRNGDFEITWVPSRANLSDPPTKEYDTSDTYWASAGPRILSYTWLAHRNRTRKQFARRAGNFVFENL